MAVERWRELPRFEGRYEISSHGRIRHAVTGRIRKLTIVPSGHVHVVLWAVGRRRQTVPVHRAVLEAFVGPCPDGLEACHSNGRPADNRLENLRWDTRSANAADAVAHGAHTNARKVSCKRGHAYDEKNTYWQKGASGMQRKCRACHRERATRARRAREAAK